MADEELTTEALEECGDLAAKLAAGVPEFRALPFLDFESENDGWSFRGIAAVYGEEADLGDFTEEFRHGAYRRTLASGLNTRLVYDHSPDHVPVLATTQGQTMQIKDDVKGLDVRGKIAQHYIGEAARELIKRGDIKGMSPGFVVGAGNAQLSMRNGRPHRIINNVKRLFEVSLTPSPAYAGTTAEVRSLWAFKMAESLDLRQQALTGAYPQLESRAEVQDAGTGDEEVKAATCECGSDPCECGAVEQRDSGVSEPDIQAELAARRRRLQLMGLTLP